jgi:6,7-dimethyl-8-ribityllumazine synthase
MSRVFEGQLSAVGLRFVIVVSRFNNFISERLLAGAQDALARTGADPEMVDVVKVPGSWEVPMVAAELARQHSYDAVICLSAVIRGETPHFDYVSAEAAKGIAHAAMETGVPVAFGVLTTNTLEQAIDRAGAKGGNKGFDAAMSAIEMANLMRGLRQAKQACPPVAGRGSARSSCCSSGMRGGNRWRMSLTPISTRSIPRNIPTATPSPSTW